MTLVKLAEDQGQAGRWEEALASSHRAIRTSPDRYEGYLTRASMRQFRGLPEQSLADLDVVLNFLEANRDQPETWEKAFQAFVMRGWVRGMVGDSGGLDDLARVDAKLANTEFRSSCPTAQAWIASLYQLSAPQGAAEACERAIQSQPDSSELHAQLGWNRMLLGKFEEAVADCNRAVTLNEQNLTAVANRGVCHLRAGHFEAAHADLSRVIGPIDDQRLHAAHALSVFALGDSATARQLLRDRIAAKPDAAEYPRVALAWIALARGEFAHSFDLFEESLGDGGHRITFYAGFGSHIARESLFDRSLALFARECQAAPDRSSLMVAESDAAGRIMGDHPRRGRVARGGRPVAHAGQFLAAAALGDRSKIQEAIANLANWWDTRSVLVPAMGWARLIGLVATRF